MEGFAKNFKQHTQEFRRLSKEVSLRPTPTKVHHLRILTRRLRSGFWIFKNGYHFKISNTLQRNMKILANKLGELRELDVLLKNAEEYKLQDKKFFLQRTQHARKLQVLLKKDQVLNKDLNALLKSTSALSPFKKKDLLSLINKDLKKWPGKLPKNKKSQHQTRIEAKKVVYRLELLGEKNSQLRLLQDHLGKVHDLEDLEKHFGSKKPLKKDIRQVLAKAQEVYGKIVK